MNGCRSISRIVRALWLGLMTCGAVDAQAPVNATALPPPNTLVPPGQDRGSSPVTLITAVQQPAAGEAAIVWVIRDPALAGRPLSAFGPSAISLADASGACTAGKAEPRLVIEPGRDNPITVCVFPKGTTRTRLLVTGSDASGQAVTATSDLLQFEEASPWWENTLFAALFSAVIGFGMGLLSTMFGYWSEGIKLRRNNRLDAEKFLIASLFPELFEHSKRVNVLLGSNLATQQDEVVKSFAQTQLTQSVYGAEMSKLTDYLSSLEPQKLLSDFKDYDAQVARYNALAQVLIREEAQARSVVESVEIAKKLRTLLEKFGVR
jgi:hypothetical protein